MSKVVVTLTTVPPRLSDVGERGFNTAISSILFQDYDGDYEVHLNIPSVLKTTGEVYVVPDWLRELAAEYPTLKIFEGVEDYGPLTKLIHTVARETDPETIIIVCDDDLVYHPKMVEEQVKNQETYIDTAIGYDGSRAEDTSIYGIMDIRNHFVVSVHTNMYVNILQHYKTISYRRRFFGPDFEDYVNAAWNDQTFTAWNDDILVSAYMGKQGLQKMVRCYEAEEQLYSEDEWRLKGGVLTFPVISHTHHHGNEGCFHFRSNGRSENFNEFHAMGHLK